MASCRVSRELPVMSTISASMESRTNTSAQAGTLPSQKRRRMPVSSTTGTRKTRIARKENFAPFATRLQQYSRSPPAQDFVIWGLTAVMKLEANCLTTSSTCKATPLAAFIATPKNMFTSRLEPCTLRTPTPEPKKLHPAKPAISLKSGRSNAGRVRHSAKCLRQ